MITNIFILAFSLVSPNEMNVAFVAPKGIYSVEVSRTSPLEAPVWSRVNGSVTNTVPGTNTFSLCGPFPADKLSIRMKRED